MKEAADALRHAVRVDPRYGLAWYRLGQVLGRLGDARGEQKAYRKAIEVDPYNLAPRLALVESLIETGHRAEARRELDQARALDPRDRQVARLAQRLEASDEGR